MNKSFSVKPAIIALLILCLLMMSSCKFVQETVLGEEIYEPKYPTQVQDKLFYPVKGSMNCQYTGSIVAYDDNIPFILTSNPYHWILTSNPKEYYHWIKCPENVGSQGCNFKISSYSCPIVLGLVETYPHYSKDGSLWQPIVGDLKLTEGENSQIKVTCRNNPQGASQTPKTTPSYSLSYSARKIYITDPEGCTNSGYLDDSNDCNLVSDDASTLKDMQPSDKPLIGTTQLRFGETKSITTCWKEQPTFGNVNPLGKYNGKDIMCRPFDGIYEMVSVGTIGGTTYNQQGSKLLSYSGTNTLCCANDECGGTYKCENYKCVAKPVICTQGQCSLYQIGQTIKLDEPSEEGGKFYLVSQTCGQDQCITQTKKEVKCTRAYCNRMSTATEKYYCNYDTGCVKIVVEEPCPAGNCCLSGGNFKIQSCTEGKQCCLSEVSDNPYLGLCKAECIPKKIEICNNKIDDDGDGKTDCGDEDCITADVCGGEKTCSDIIQSECKFSVLNSNSYFSCQWDKLSCAVKAYFMFLKIGTALLALIITILVSNFELNKKYLKGNKNKMARLLISFFIALIVAVLVYVYWWTIFIILVLYLIIKARLIIKALVTFLLKK